MTVMLLLVVLVVSGWQATPGRADHSPYVFSSYANLMKLYYLEEEGLSNVDVFLREELVQHGTESTVDELHNLTAVRKVVEDAKETHVAVGNQTRQYLAHPVNVYHLVHRLATGWLPAIHLIRQSTPCKKWHMPQMLRRLQNLEENLPSQADLTSLTYNLLTIQHAQHVPTKLMMEGRLGPHASLRPISPHQQFQVARLAVEEDDYYYAAQWLKQLAGRADLGGMRREEDGFNATNVLGMLASAYFRINMIPEALKVTDQLLKQDPSNMVARSNKAFYEQRLTRLKPAPPGPPRRPAKEDPFRAKYEALCRGSKIKVSRRKCKLVPTWPGSLISFHKMEVLKHRPPILIFHDVIGARDAKHVVRFAEEEYEQAAMDSEEGFKTPDFTLVLSRALQSSSQAAALKTRVQRVVSRVKNTLASLPFTVSKPYAVGESEARNFGHQGFFFKPTPQFQIQNLGGHVGTAMIFLNDVEMGGEIVFPTANTRVSPRMGSVLFYFPSMGRLHTICPVAYGTEWLLVHSFFEKAAPSWCRRHEDPDNMKPKP